MFLSGITCCSLGGRASYIADAADIRHVMIREECPVECVKSDSLFVDFELDDGFCRDVQTKLYFRALDDRGKRRTRGMGQRFCSGLKNTVSLDPFA
jgi:hypothetical protein